MRAILNNDIIVKWVLSKGVEIGNPPNNAGLERLRYDGKKIVDLMDRKRIYVEIQNGVFILHVKCPTGKKWKLVRMSYIDRKKLVNNNGTIHIKTNKEINEEKIQKQKRINDRLIEKRLQKEIGSDIDQKKIINNILCTIIDYIINDTQNSKDILNQYLNNNYTSILRNNNNGN